MVDNKEELSDRFGKDLVDQRIAKAHLKREWAEATEVYAAHKVMLGTQWCDIIHVCYAVVKKDHHSSQRG